MSEANALQADLASTRRAAHTASKRRLQIELSMHRDTNRRQAQQQIAQQHKAQESKASEVIGEPAAGSVAKAAAPPRRARTMGRRRI